MQIYNIYTDCKSENDFGAKNLYSHGRIGHTASYSPGQYMYFFLALPCQCVIYFQMSVATHASQYSYMLFHNLDTVNWEIFDLH